MALTIDRGKDDNESTTKSRAATLAILLSFLLPPVQKTRPDRRFNGEKLEPTMWPVCSRKKTGGEKTGMPRRLTQKDGPNQGPNQQFAAQQAKIALNLVRMGLKRGSLGRSQTLLANRATHI